MIINFVVFPLVNALHSSLRQMLHQWIISTTGLQVSNVPIYQVNCRYVNHCFQIYVDRENGPNIPYVLDIIGLDDGM